MRSRWLLVAPLVLVLLSLAGCRTAPDDEMSRPTQIRTVRPSGVATPLPAQLPTAAVVPVDTLVWGRANRLHVGDQSLDVSPLRISGLAQTAGGLYVRSGERLWSTDLHTLHDTGLDVPGPLVVSPDRRYLAFIDLTHGTKDTSGTPLATAVAYDTVSRRLVVASTQGMGDPRKDDLKNLYEESSPQLMGFEGDRLLVDTPNGDYALPLDGSKAVPVNTPTTPPDLEVQGATDLGSPVAAHRRGDRFVIDRHGHGALLGPEGRFGLVDEEGVHRFVAFGAKGAPVHVIGLPDKLFPGPWDSPTTFFGIAARGDDDRPEGIVRCDLAMGRCQQVVSAVAAGRDPLLSGLDLGRY